MIPKYILTESQARALRAASDYNINNYYELASAARMTPTQVSEVIRELSEKHFIELGEPNSPYFKLTGEGFKVRSFLDQQNRKMSQQSKYSFSPVEIVPDDERKSATEAEAEKLTPDELSSALDEAIRRLE
ncbi:MAG TPA: hypothetical protein VF596_22035 [Pyrinomonadaceae bacterium]|jgi:hypothetical protein